MKTSQSLVRAFLPCLVFLICLQASARTISIGRYVAVPEKPRHEQTHLLAQQIQIIFPQNVLTIGEALQFMLQFSGYHLVNTKQLSQATQVMLKQRLPEIDRKLGPVNLLQGLMVLAGPPFIVLVDPVHRLVGFQLKPNDQYLFDPTNHS